jgi:branched-chain amino acid transport system permease protein
MKTSYAQDNALVRSAMSWGVLAAIVAGLIVVPHLVNDFLLTQLTFTLIFCIAGLGLQLLLGYTGQASLGHAAFMGIGAYATAYLEKVGMDGTLAIVGAAVIATSIGAVVALPAMRLRGLYLVVATIAFGFIVEEVAARWTSVTGGNDGATLRMLTLMGRQLDKPWHVFYVCSAMTLASFWLARNILRAPLGRAMTAVRDSEVAAQSMGVSVKRTKAIAFALSGMLVGISGSLYAHALSFVSPEQFTITLSLDLVVLVMVGGMASLRGVVFGALFVVMLPEAIRAVMELFYPGRGEIQGVRPFVSGAILVAVMLFEQRGIEGLWRTLLEFVRAFPFYRLGMLRKQRSYLRSERW